MLFSKIKFLFSECIFIFFKLLHAVNVPSLIFGTDSGINTLCNCLQALKVFDSILTILLGITNFLNPQALKV